MCLAILFPTCLGPKVHGWITSCEMLVYASESSPPLTMQNTTVHREVTNVSVNAFIKNQA